MFNSAFAKENLFESPIDLMHSEYKLNEFCEKFINNIDIEKFIKKEIQNDYIVVSLDECISVALQNNFDIKIKDHQFKSSKYEYQNALSKFLPILKTTSYIADYRGQILVGGVLRDDFHETALSVNLSAEHQLLNGGRDIFTAKALSELKKAKRHDFNYTKSETIYYTSKYYYEMLLAKINIEIYLRNLIERNAQLTLTKNLKDAGLGTQFDVIRSKSEQAQASASLLDSLNKFRISQTDLANIMGIEVETALMPFEQDIQKLDLILENVQTDDLFKLAIEKREDLKAFKNLISYEKNIKNTYITEFFPKPFISFAQQYQGTFNTSVKPNYILAGYLSWQPGENTIFGTATKIKNQNEKLKIKSLELERLLRNIKEQIVNNISTSNFMRKQIDVTKSRVDYSNESIKLAMLRYNHGKGILLDVIQAQSEMTQARVQYTSSIIKYNLSQIALAFYSGTITEDLIIKNYKP